MKKDYSEKKFSRSRQRAKLLIANPKFQEEVLDIRKKFNIPQNGIKTNEESEKWHHNFYVSDDTYFETNRGRIREDIERLEKEKKFREGFDLHRKFNKEAPINAFSIAIKNLLKKYKLPLNWHHSVQRYVLFNNIDAMWYPGNILIRQDIDQDTDLRTLSIEIDDTTTLDDVKNAWPMIKFRQKKLASYTKKKFQPIKNFERDQLAYNLKQSGKKYDEIATILSKKYKKIISYDDVASYIKRHKQKIGIN